MDPAISMICKSLIISVIDKRNLSLFAMYMLISVNFHVRTGCTTGSVTFLRNDTKYYEGAVA